MTVRQVAIVGAGIAGVTAAETLRERGFDGSITMLDADPRTPYDRPALSKTGLRSGQPVHIRPSEAWDRLDVDLRLGVAAIGVDVDGHAVLTADGSVAYDRLLLATGGIARWPASLQRVEGAGVLRSPADADALRVRLVPGARLVVVGAGLIGCEVAATARGLGVHVTLVDPVPHPLAAVLGADTAQAVLDRHRAEDVDLVLGRAVRALTRDRELLTVELDDGAGLTADAVLVAVGGAAASAWLQGSGLQLADPAPHGGVRCSRTLCAAPDVYVAGDLAVPDEIGRSEHWMAAVEQAEVAAANLLRPDDEGDGWAPAPWFWTDQYDLKIQATGLPPAVPPALHESSPDGRRQLRVWADDRGRATAAVTVNWGARAAQWRERIRQGEPVDLTAASA